MNGRNVERIHEDVFEAFIGALFLSNGFEPCCLLIVNLLETLIDYGEKLYCDNNYKDILLRHHHTKEWIHPKYEKLYTDERIKLILGDKIFFMLSENEKSRIGGLARNGRFGARAKDARRKGF